MPNVYTCQTNCDPPPKKSSSHSHCLLLKQTRQPRQTQLTYNNHLSVGSCKMHCHLCVSFRLLFFFQTAFLNTMYFYLLSSLCANHYYFLFVEGRTIRVFFHCNSLLNNRSSNNNNYYNCYYYLRSS